MNEAVESHREAVREMSRAGGPLTPDAPTATTNNPAWWLDGIRTAERRALHGRIFSDAIESADAGYARQAIVMAGPPGAGKSFARAEVLKGRSESFLVIDPDELKKALLEVALADGSYESRIMPPEVRERIAAGDQFFPLDHASLVHEESSFMARRLRDQSIAVGRNILIDGVMGDEKKARQLAGDLQAARYSIWVVDVEVPMELSEARVRARFEHDYLAALRGEPGFELGGRPVPSEFYKALFDQPGGRSRSEAAAAMVAQTCPTVLEYWRFRTSGTDVTASPVLESHCKRAFPGAALVDQELGSAAPRTDPHGQRQLPPERVTSHLPDQPVNRL